MLEKSFEAATVEPRIAKIWDDAGAFKAGAGSKPGADPYAIVIPPPNVTGSLHMGHALNNTLQDILVRFERMRGRDVLWQPGMDHAGIATQMVVERQLTALGKKRTDFTRPEFLQKIWEWKAESGGLIFNQLKRLGASCDWSREKFTMGANGQAGDQMVDAVTEVFVQLYNTVLPDGTRLIYKDKRLVNWDPKLLTAISDLEVEQIEVKGSFSWSQSSGEALDNEKLEKILDRQPSGHLYYFRYPIIDDQGKETGEVITVATTRPETMLGDTGIAVNPTDPKYLHLHNKYARLPLVGRRLKIVPDDYSDPEKGTGAVKITPAHDKNDFEVGKRHGLSALNIMAVDASLNFKDDLEFWENTIYAEQSLNGAIGAISSIGQGQNLNQDWLAKLNGKLRFEARKIIVAKMADLGLLDKIEPHIHMVPHGDRSGVPIEDFLTEQWYANAAELAKPATAAVREGRTKFVPENWDKTYYQWMENIQPWCISRQLWWGHQIPAWYGPAKKEENDYCDYLGNKAKAFVAKDKYAAEELAKEYYKEFNKNISFESNAFPNLKECIEMENSNLIDVTPNSIGLRKYNIEHFAVIGLKRDPDVLDTWFSSALWPFSTQGWPKKDDKTVENLKKYYPTSVLVTGFDIIFFWVARMMMMGLHFMKDEAGKPVEPFHTVYVHALVRDKNGQKMSKSKGNVIDPLELIDEYGADALRFTLAIMAAQGRDVKLDPTRIAGYRNFGTKLWNATRFAQMNGMAADANFMPETVKSGLNRWIITELTRASRTITESIETYRFNDAASAAYKFVWNQLCDWYVELLKPVFMGDNEADKAEAQGTLAYVLDETYRLLHPFMPFMTEELWALTAGEGNPRATLLCHAAWPQPTFEDVDAAGDINWLIDLVTSIRSVRAEMNVPAGATAPIVVVGAGDLTKARLTRNEASIKRLARVTEITHASDTPKNSAQLVLNEATICLPLGSLIDLTAERARLTKEQGKVQGDMDKINAKLGNERFVANAKEEVVAAERARHAELTLELQKIAEALVKLSEL